MKNQNPTESTHHRSRKSPAQAILALVTLTALSGILIGPPHFASRAANPQSIAGPSPAMPGTGTTWSPFGHGTIAWYEADQITGLTDGTNLADWPDMSGNGDDATASGGSQPTYKSAILNGLPIVRFNGSNQMKTTAFTLNQPSTVFLVASTASGNNQGYVDGLADSTRGIQIYAPNLYLESGNSFSAGFTGTSSAAVIIAIFNSANSLISFNGTSATGTLNNTNASGLTLGAFGASDLFFLGDIAEIGALPQAASVNLRQCLEGYAAWKWALQPKLPANHPYRNFPPPGAANCN